jgi:hypothetical protein
MFPEGVPLIWRHLFLRPLFLKGYVSFLSVFYILLLPRGFGPIANYADRATAACWRSSANFADRGCCVVSATDPPGSQSRFS